MRLVTPPFICLNKQVLYKQKWEESKDVYQLPCDAPELVRAVKFAEAFSQVIESIYQTEPWQLLSKCCSRDLLPA